MNKIEYRLKETKRRFLDFLLNRVALPIIRKQAKDSNYIRHFQKEMEFARKGKKACGIDALMDEQVCDLLALLSSQGDSGFSIGFKRMYLTKAMMFEIFSPLTFEDSEFGSDYGGDSVQNVRDSSVFKDKESGRIYDIDSFSKRTSLVYNVDTRELTKGNNLTWNGCVMVYDDLGDKGWFGATNGYINPENKHYTGDNKVIVPTIEIIDNKCDRGTFIMSITKMSAFPKKFFKDYELVPSDKKWAKDDIDFIMSDYRREVMLHEALKQLPVEEEK